MIRNLKNFSNRVLIIVDVQKSFSKFFTDRYLSELKSYCSNYKNVYQIWDNHVDGVNVDNDYLFSEYPDPPTNDDLYHFPNQSDLFEKRYNYNVDISFYKNLLDEKTFRSIERDEKENNLKKGQSFFTEKGTLITFIGNKHRWAHIGTKLVEFLSKIKESDVTIVGGSNSECLEDIYISFKSFGLNIKKDNRYIYSGSHCPIK